MNMKDFISWKVLVISMSKCSTNQSGGAREGTCIQKRLSLSGEFCSEHVLPQRNRTSNSAFFLFLKNVVGSRFLDRSDPGIQKFEIWTPQRRQDLGPPTPDSGFDTISIQFNSSTQFHISVSGLQYIYALHTIFYGEAKNTPFVAVLFSYTI